MRRILLAVGQAATTLQTARQIRPWLRERDTSLTLMAVVDSSPLSPLSETKRALEQVEAIFTDAAEKPGIIVRVADEPAAEICRETSQNLYDLVAIGLRDRSQRQETIGSTCRQVLNRCTVPLFIIPPTLHQGITPQILIVMGDESPAQPIADWMIAQCQAQKLNAILYAASLEQSACLTGQMAKRQIRAQTVIHSGLTADNILALSQDRRVRWIVVPTDMDRRNSSPNPLVHELLAKSSCPVLIQP